MTKTVSLSDFTYERIKKFIEKVWGKEYEGKFSTRFYRGRSFDDAINEILNFAIIEYARDDHLKVIK